MGIEHHLLGFAGVGGDKHLPAVGQSEVGDLDGECYTADLHVFLAPVKLAGIARGKGQGHKGFFDRRFRLCRLPLLHEALHAVVGTAISLGLQTFKESLGGASLRLREVTLGDQTAFQYRLEITQHDFHE
ncbi:MAG: hypothetical protein Q8R95_07400 [Azonexus sp.]|nr:hypothetical protein [Azonexus sp.]